MENKIKFLDIEGLGLYVSVKDFCEYLLSVKCLTEKKSKMLYWKMRKENVSEINNSLKRGFIASYQISIVPHMGDFYASWTFFSRTHKFIKNKDNEAFKEIMLLLDMPNSIRFDKSGIFEKVELTIK